VSITFSCECGKVINAPDGSGGKRARCPGCGDLVKVPTTTDPAAVAAAMEAAANAPQETQTSSTMPPRMDPQLLRHPAASSAIGTNPAPDHEQKVWEYKILTQKDKWFSGKFDPERLEQALNAYARQGWRLRGMATASIPGFVSANREELIFVLER
jgi:hypothetical protein